MRIGIDASNLRAGGGLTHVRELLQAAQPQEYRVKQVIVWGGKNTLKQLPCRRWLKCVHEPLLDRPLPFRLSWQNVTLSQLAKQHCDSLFVPGGSYRGSFRPFVMMSRNLLPFEEHERNRYGLSWMFMKLRLLQFRQTRSLRTADGVIFLTEYARSVLKREVNLSGWQTLIPHGVNPRFYRPPRVQRPIGTYSKRHPFKFLYVSTIDVYKHQWHVAEAVAELRKDGLPVVLDLVGPAYAPALRRLRRIMKSIDPGSEFIRYRGAVPSSELPYYYHQADGFVFASSCENMPNILLEAMASGLPIACSKRGPMPEMLGNAGIYFDPEQPVEIAGALDLLMDSPSLREHCASLAYQQAQHYSWERCAGETFSFLTQVAQSVRTGVSTMGSSAATEATGRRSSPLSREDRF